MTEYNWDDEEKAHEGEIRFEGEITCLGPLLLGDLVESDYYLSEAFKIKRNCCEHDAEILDKALSIACERMVDLYYSVLGLDDDYDGDFNPDISQYSYHIYRDLMKKDK